MDLFDRFRRATHRLFKDFIDSRRYALTLDLVHPTRPSAGPYLQYLRTAAASTEFAHLIDSFFDAKSVKAAHGTRSIIYQIVRVCLVEGKQKDAAWFLDFAHGNRPELLETGAVLSNNLDGLEKVHSEREITVYRRKATAEEIQAGVIVDELGYVELSPQMMMKIRDARRSAALDEYRKRAK